MGDGHGKWHYPAEDICKYWGKEWRREKPLPDGEKDRIWTPPCHTDDILYAQETFCIDSLSDIIGTGRVCYKADGTYSDFCFNPKRYEIMRRAQLKSGWISSRNMPREIARVFLRVTDVRVERLQDITPKQAQAEGCKGWFVATTRDWDKNPDYITEYRSVWGRSIKKADLLLYGWAANPFVWVIQFERISKEEAFKQAKYISR